jgi:hypothetical protein
MSVWGDAKVRVLRYDNNRAFSSNCDAEDAPNGEISQSWARLIAPNRARCALIEKKMVVQGLGGCLKVVSERHGHVSAPVSEDDHTPQGFVVRLSTDYSYWMSRAQL